MQIPSQYQQLMPYMIVPKAYQFIDFMKKVFDAVEQIIVPRSEGVIMHGELRIGDSIIMFADSTEDIAPRPAGIFIYVEKLEEIYRKALAEGASSTMKPAQQSYGYACGFHDPFGNDWWPVQADAINN